MISFIKEKTFDVQGYGYLPDALPSAEASLSRKEAGERKKCKRTVDDGKGKERKRGSSHVPSSPARFVFFLLLLFFLGYPAGASEENRVSDTTINA